MSILTIWTVFLMNSFRILQPNTPYRILTVKSAICAGGLFYCMSNITESCIGVFQSFLSLSTPPDPMSFKASHLLLSRILIYMHKKFMVEGMTSVLGTDLPNLETMDGVLALLSLTNIAELGNILHPDTNQEGIEPKERAFLIHVRKLGRHLSQWLGDHYLIEPAVSTIPDKRPLSKIYLLRQVHALQSGVREMMKAGVSPSISRLTSKSLIFQLIGCMGLSNDLAGYADSFAWEMGTHKVSKRSTPLLSEFGMYTFT